MRLKPGSAAMILAAGIMAWAAPYAGAQATRGQEAARPTTSKVAHDASYEKVREQLLDVLAAEEYDKVDVRAATFGTAMALLRLGLDTYLEGAIKQLGSVERAGEYGGAILQGLEDAKVRYDDYGGTDLVGGQSLVVHNEAEARDLGAMMLGVSGLLAEARAGHGASLRSAARRVFEGLKVIPGTGQSLVTQYADRLSSLSRSDRDEMIRWIHE